MTHTVEEFNVDRNEQVSEVRVKQQTLHNVTTDSHGSRPLQLLARVFSVCMLYWVLEFSQILNTDGLKYRHIRYIHQLRC